MYSSGPDTFALLLVPVPHAGLTLRQSQPPLFDAFLNLEFLQSEGCALAVMNQAQVVNEPTGIARLSTLLDWPLLASLDETAHDVGPIGIRQTDLVKCVRINIHPGDGLCAPLIVEADARYWPGSAVGAVVAGREL